MRCLRREIALRPVHPVEHLQEAMALDARERGPEGCVNLQRAERSVMGIAGARTIAPLGPGRSGAAEKIDLCISLRGQDKACLARAHFCAIRCGLGH